MFVYIVKVLSPLECYEPWCANKCSSRHLCTPDVPLQNAFSSHFLKNISTS